MPSSTVENYLKQILLTAQEHAEERVPMGRVAAALGVVPGTATSMIKGLARSGLVDYEPRVGVVLTPEGERIALRILRRHRLVELFLVQTLGLDWSEIHEEAEQLEHVISERVLDRIDALLGFPTVDPHGDPIPTKKGILQERKLKSLAICPVGGAVTIARIADQEAEFLQYVESTGLKPGIELQVERRTQAADALTVRLSSGKHLTLGLAAAAKIFVE